MKIKEIDVVSSAPFKNDRLNRKPTVELLSALIENLETPFVFSINSPWGTGKTTFIRMWKCHLESLGYRCIYFNAWENDFSEEPFISFVSQIKSEFSEKKLEKYFDKAKSVGGFLLKRALPVAIRLGSQGLIDLDKGLEDSIGDLSKQIAEDAIEKYESTRKSVSEFRNDLEKLVVESNSQEPISNKPLIIFVDELDRCQPLYTVLLLERIKHIFNAKGIVFVLSIDRKQVGTSLRSLYGSETNSEAYMKRIIDLDYTLPIPSKREFIRTCLEKMNFQKVIEHFQLQFETIEKNVRLAVDAWNLSLREIEHYCVVLYTVYSTTRNNSELVHSYLMFLLGMRMAERETYDSYIKGEYPANELINRIAPLLANREYASFGEMVTGYLMFENIQMSEFDAYIQ